ncbi:MAG TPA: NAD(P)/FAD-dependent oxidoreductase [Gemmatimonadales bacterium]|jgi:phytoene dehydrogenase-like protein|nr:NAD(P)/FAD-dependent oxidoreductase [Gemmatimonadales bacterium]
MSRRSGYDAVVVGGGPNGLAAAITLARAGRSVQLVEAAPTVGGGCRSAELTLPGFLHDVCSAVYPMGHASPFFSQLPLARHGVGWIQSEAEYAHPLEDGTALSLRDLDATAKRLGRDERAYRELVEPAVRDWRVVFDELAAPLHIPRGARKMVAAARFGVRALQPASMLAGRFRTPAARALLAGCAAHSMLQFSEPLTGAFALIFLASAHAVGWPIVAGGSQRLPDALAACLTELGGEIVTGRPISSIDQLPPHRAALFDLTPRQMLAIAGQRLRAGFLGRCYVRQLGRFRYGPGTFKLDLALDGPIPWRDPETLRAATVHVGGSFEEIAAAEAAVAEGRIAERPFVLLAQPSLFDPSRAPEGRHTVWAYCHVPNGSAVDMTDRILAQIERFAPGFRDRILAVSRLGPADLERYNANCVGGDIGGGRPDIRQFFTRPAWRPDPYRTPDPAILICSSSSPPGAGVHGLCGWYSARSALRGVLR